MTYRTAKLVNLDMITLIKMREYACDQAYLQHVSNISLYQKSKEQCPSRKPQFHNRMTLFSRSNQPVWIKIINANVKSCSKIFYYVVI